MKYNQTLSRTHVSIVNTTCHLYNRSIHSTTMGTAHSAHLKVGSAEVDPLPPLDDEDDDEGAHSGREQGEGRARTHDHQRGETPESGIDPVGREQDAAAAAEEGVKDAGGHESSDPEQDRAPEQDVGQGVSAFAIVCQIVLSA